MADTTVSTLAPKKRRGIFRKLIWILGVLVVLLVVVYFVATSSAFFKGVILPRISKSLGAKVTVSSASIHPFSRIELRDLKVQSAGQEPLVIAPEVRARYSLMDIIRGKISVSELTLVSPTISVVENSDGSSNLDALTKKKESRPNEKKSEKKSEKPTQLNIQKVALNNATIRQIKLHTNGTQSVTEISNLTVTLDDLQNGRSGKFTVNADVKMDNRPPAGTNGLLEAKIAGGFSFALAADAKPVSLQGETKLTVTKADGAFADLSSLTAALNADMTPTEVKQIALTFQRNGTQLGQVRASGPFDAAKTEGKLTVEILSIDRQVLNLVGAASGIDFGTTKINSTNQIEFTKGGTVITAIGKLDAAAVRVTRAGQTTPTLNASADYDVTVDHDGALMRTLTITGTQNDRPLLRANLTSPMFIALGDATNSASDAAWNVSLTNFNLADWKPFIGETASSGSVGLTAKLLSQQGGKQLTFDISSHIANLTAQVASNKIENADVDLTARGKATDMKQLQLQLAEYRIELKRDGQRLAIVSGSGTYDEKTGAADLMATVEAALASLAKAMPQSDFAATGGSLNLSAHILQKAGTQTVTGKLTLADFTGKFGENKFENFGTIADLDVAKKNSQIQLRKAAGTMTESQKAGGSYDISGNYDTDKKTGHFSVKLADLNQNGLRPFLESALKDKKLVSVAMNGDLSANLGNNGDKSVKGSMHITDLVVADTQNPKGGKPLAAKLSVDADVKNQIADVRQLQITLTPTTRAKNELNFTGRVDMTKTNADGALKLVADSLDVTEYYDLFTANETNVTAANGQTTPAPVPVPATSTAPQKEPDAVHLPVGDLSLDMNVGRFYLREIAITNLQTTAKVQGSHLILKPLQLSLNGAPASATVDVDLGVAGYKYEVSVNLQHVPFAPLVNSFQPDRKGQIGGTLDVKAQFKGAGITDPSIQTNLTGQFDIGTTNLNLAVKSLRSPLLKSIVNIIAVLPTLLKDPGAGVESLLGAVTQKSGGGVVGEIESSPINVIEVRGVVGDRRVDVQHSLVESPVFEVTTKGDIKLAEVLTNSAIHFPLEILLRRSLADKIGYAPNGTATNAAYVKLPQFVTERGTIGKPKPDINKTALGLSTIKTLVPAIVGEKQLDKLGLGGLLGQKKPPASTQTNVAPQIKTNSPSLLNDALDLFNKPKKKKK